MKVTEERKKEGRKEKKTEKVEIDLKGCTCYNQKD